MNNNADEMFRGIEKLPIVLCHRDFWVANIIYSDSDSEIVLIDWDTAGWGYMGEDIASLKRTKRTSVIWLNTTQNAFPPITGGGAEYSDVSHISDHCVP